MKKPKKTKALDIKVSCNIDQDTDSRLEELAISTGRTKSFYVREAITKYLDIFEKQGREHLVTDFK